MTISNDIQLENIRTLILFSLAFNLIPFVLYQISNSEYKSWTNNLLYNQATRYIFTSICWYYTSYHLMEFMCIKIFKLVLYMKQRSINAGASCFLLNCNHITNWFSHTYKYSIGGNAISNKVSAYFITIF